MKVRSFLFFSTPESTLDAGVQKRPLLSLSRPELGGPDVRSIGRRVMMRTLSYEAFVRPEFQLYTIAWLDTIRRSPKYSHGTRAPYGCVCMNLDDPSMHLPYQKNEKPSYWANV